MKSQLQKLLEQAATWPDQPERWAYRRSMYIKCILHIVDSREDATKITPLEWKRIRRYWNRVLDDTWVMYLELHKHWTGTEQNKPSLCEWITPEDFERARAWAVEAHAHGPHKPHLLRVRLLKKENPYKPVWNWEIRKYASAKDREKAREELSGREFNIFNEKYIIEACVIP